MPREFIQLQVINSCFFVSCVSSFMKPFASQPKSSGNPDSVFRDRLKVVLAMPTEAYT